MANSYRRSYGPIEPRVRFEDGTPAWEYFDDPLCLRRHPEQSIGFITFSNGKNDNDIGWQQQSTSSGRCRKRGSRISSSAVSRDTVSVWRCPLGTENGEMPLDIRSNQSLPAFTRSSLERHQPRRCVPLARWRAGLHILAHDGIEAAGLCLQLRSRPSMSPAKTSRTASATVRTARTPRKDPGIDLNMARANQERPFIGTSRSRADFVPKNGRAPRSAAGALQRVRRARPPPPGQ